MMIEECAERLEEQQEAEDDMSMQITDDSVERRYDTEVRENLLAEDGERENNQTMSVLKEMLGISEEKKTNKKEAGYLQEKPIVQEKKDKDFVINICSDQISSDTQITLTVNGIKIEVSRQEHTVKKTTQNSGSAQNTPVRQEEPCEQPKTERQEETKENEDTQQKPQDAGTYTECHELLMRLSQLTYPQKTAQQSEQYVADVRSLISDTGAMLMEFEHCRVDCFISALADIEENIKEQERYLTEETAAETGLIRELMYLRKNPNIEKWKDSLEKERTYYKKLNSFLAELGCERISVSTGDPYDADIMEAENLEDMPTDGKLCVKAVTRQGYRWNNGTEYVIKQKCIVHLEEKIR